MATRKYDIGFVTSQGIVCHDPVRNTVVFVSAHDCVETKRVPAYDPRAATVAGDCLRLREALRGRRNKRERSRLTIVRNELTGIVG